MKDKILVAAAVVTAIVVAIVLYRMVQFTHACNADGGVALREVWGGWYCLKP